MTAKASDLKTCICSCVTGGSILLEPVVAPRKSCIADATPVVIAEAAALLHSRLDSRWWRGRIPEEGDDDPRQMISYVR